MKKKICFLKLGLILRNISHQTFVHIYSNNEEIIRNIPQNRPQENVCKRTLCLKNTHGINHQNVIKNAAFSMFWENMTPNKYKIKIMVNGSILELKKIKNTITFWGPRVGVLKTSNKGC